MNSCEPRDRALAIVEIVKNVLRYLCYEELLVVMRVNKQFNAIIDGSPLLQRILRFEHMASNVRLKSP